ncbi:hypothetical protein GCM10023063_19200 [Arthrobacter methylotrophus]|uniref:Uncharacterized protein n=1 Tax=Arthrobacter methylotrophus TaxID=121291 RepID=A0ABV5UP79_9MICC
MKRVPAYITVREDHTTIINNHPEGFPVDGDASNSNVTLQQRAAALIASDPGLLAAARAWLGSPLHTNHPLAPEQVATHIARLYCGGAPRFITFAPSLQKALVAS